MSEGIVRKVQPFTIGTRLSIPAVPKCPDFPAGYLPAPGLDNCPLQHNLNHDSVSLYLSRSHACTRGPCLRAPLARQVASVRRRQEHMQAAEDHLNQNTVSASAVSRSIKKIAISGSGEDAGRDKVQGEERDAPPIVASPSENHNNNNNNNITVGSPRIVGVSCENKASSHFQVLLRKDGDDEPPPGDGQTKLALDREKTVQQTSVARGQSAKTELQKRDGPPHTPNEGSKDGPAQTDCFTQRTSLFTKEILQAEAWIRGKLQDLKDGCNIQRCPLQDWEEASQTLLRDLKHFENTHIQLNQMGEQLICKLNPTSDLVRKQLSQLRDQWQILKQTAANQSRALGGAKSLQEFNRKVDKMEAWIKQKQEEEQSLVNVLGENADKMQLTRRILDLKQDEQLYRNLHEEINHLALKLEKQGKTDGKNIASRRKHINKMWLKVQSHLKNYHENLQLALEVSSFYQQADNTLFSMGSMAKGLPASKEQERCGDREIRDIASQIMMLDVTVSQLSNLHPALSAGVTQKQSEVKDCWALLQKTVRSDRAALQAAVSTLTREDVDLLTPSGEAQCTVGTEPPRIMGKEVKEEQNRLKGCVITRESGSCRRTAGDPSQEQKSGSHGGALPLGDSPAPVVNDVTVRHQSEGERKQRAEPKLAAALQGHPQLHVQLQRFTVSADKTLSWLKKNVAMATQVCPMVGYEGLEAAKRCQDALEEEILSNRARIEVVKKEGRGLVRAQHPGSAKIEEFLGQLEVLWEELRRRHRRNSVFLQASEELGFRVVKVLQALGSLQAWLDSVELSLRESSLAGDPETVSAAEKESRLLLREVAARGLELYALRQEVEKLRGQCHPHARSLPAHMEEVERKYHRVQSALTQQSSELQDTRMLTEFLERVELEESQELTGGHYSLGQPFHGEITSTPTLLGLQSSGGGDPLMESMGDPVEELREAVEMLNDTVRERGRAQSHDQAVQELLSKHASLAVHVEECLCCCKELSMDILERETDMATKCELDHCGLEGLQEQQDRLEVDREGIRQQVEGMKARASRLEELCPNKLRFLRVRIQATLQAWTELGEGLVENRRRLREFLQLQDFFRSYLGMILWTEDTRSRIFSELTLHHGKDGEESLAAELDFQIEQKFEEFDELSTTGNNLLPAEHHLNKMVRERMEELRSMLGWILVHWRAQKQQWLLKRKREEPSQDNIYSEATVCLPLAEGSAQKPEDHNSHRSPAPSAGKDGQSPATDTQMLASPARQAREPDQKCSEDWYEVMKSIGPQGGEVASSESPKPPVLLLKEPGSPARAGTVSLILSFGNTGDGPAQLLEPPPRMEEAAGETSEPVHRVSTYLHVKDNNMAVTPVYESITLPRQKSCPASSVSSSLAPSSSSPPAPASQTASVSFHPMVGSGSASIFSSLKRMGKKRKRKRDARRHTIQRILGVEEPVEEEPRYTCETTTYSTHTWPLKEGRKKKSSTACLAGGEGGEHMAYKKNPLLKDIDTECSGEYSIIPYAVSEGPSAPAATAPVRSHCRFLSLGSVLSFDLPKDVSLIPSIQDIITIAPPESKTGSVTHPDSCSQRPTSLSSFKQTRAQPASTQSPMLMGSPAGPPETQTHVTVSDADERPLGPSTPFQGGRGEDQTVPCRDLCKTRCSCSVVTGLHGDGEQENTSPQVISAAASAETAGQPSRSLGDSPLVQVHSTPRATHTHECLSVHTLIKDLHGHQYHRTARPPSPRGDSPGQSCTQSPGQAAHMVVNLRSALNVTVRENSVDSGVSSSGSFKLCSDAASLDIPLPQGVVGRLMSLEVGGIDCTNARFDAQGFDQSPDSTEPETEPIHPDHQQFEEEEKELEDIWNHSNSYRQSICSDIMYQPHPEDVHIASHQPTEPSIASSSPKPQAVLYRKLTTASAPNLLVAELRLPASIQSVLGYDKEQRSRDQPLPLAKRDRRSWAAFPHREQPCKAPFVVNETASDRLKLPEIRDNQRYIYQYRAEEEEEEDREGEAKMGEPTGCSKDPSMSLLSVHMGLDGVCQRDTETQEQSTTTGGQHSTTSGKPELLAMEGTLERKHKLQLGGKKASCRAWSPCHAVLYRHTLCFYQDRKDTLRSSVCGLPLNLHGADCSPAPEYTKKPNCFRLRLRDGSEYLLNASSRFLMKKWILRIQANTGLSEGSLSASDVPVIQDLPVHSSSCGNQTLRCSRQGLAKCCCSSSPHTVVSTFPRRKPTSSARAKEIVVLTRDYSYASPSLSKGPDDPPHVSSSKTGGGDDFRRWTPTQRLSAGYRDSRSFSPQSSESCGPEWPANKRRSHSFTSATYQKIKPVKAPPGGREQEGSSNYSVTLVIGDKSSNMTWQQEVHQDMTLRSYASLPRPRNKSVFKKFFGRKDGHI